MQSIIQFLKSRFYIAFSIAMMLILVLVNLFFVLQSDGRNKNKVLSFNEEFTQVEKQNNLAAVLESNPNLSNAPHPSCVAELTSILPTSDVYNVNTAYDLSFIHTSATSSNPHSVFQDVNGDNLPDYIYAYNVHTSGNIGGVHSFVSIYYGCLYLNNGNGWTKAHQCYALTQQHYDTGAFINKEYRGDCAGEPTVVGSEQ